MLKSSLVAIALMGVSQSAFAQQAIGAGGQIQQIPPAPALQKSVPDIRIDRREAPATPGPVGAKVLINSLHVTGQTLFSEAQLIAVTGFKPGAELSLPDLRAMAMKITSYYNRRGYFVAQAYVPAQDIKDGAVTIAVIEGHYGKIILHNRTNLSNGLIWSVLHGLNSGDLVATAPLERRLLLISDMPDVQVKSTLTPGAAVGTSDLIVDVAPGRRVTGSVEADNAGNPYTGPYRLGATVNINDPFGQGDVFSVRVLSSFSGMDYVRASYQAQVQDATVGVSYAYFDYRLGRQFSSLHASGTEEIASVYGSYPLIRSYNTNLTAQVDFDARTFQDKVGATSSVTDKQAWVLIAGFTGDHRDTFGGGGWTSYSLSGSFGDLDIRSADARAWDALTARTDGQYEKLSFSVSRLQQVVGPLSLYGWVRGQIASKNLDVSEKMELGGAYAVRAYPEGEAYGDEGYVATLEARLLLPALPEHFPGRFQLFGFVDTGSVTLDKSPWFTGPDSATRSGAGVGITWTAVNNFVVTVTYAHKLGDAMATSAPDAPDRFWIQAAKYF
jgi:hemolysin activation/secretion protein